MTSSRSAGVGRCGRRGCNDVELLAKGAQRERADNSEGEVVVGTDDEEVVVGSDGGAMTGSRFASVGRRGCRGCNGIDCRRGGSERGGGQQRRRSNSRGGWWPARGGRQQRRRSSGGNVDARGGSKWR
ncbi:uncharacterized protein LOC120288362 [Eucalyptus grandis]|uniref:uncharacterized protein LOC120288362 n=1 Tax=Eucalyptus grandis TaxID=71139 RepID=UPI00192EE459|nr:uncharacterized protein LOC120288362 [Eucalyptus grandis]